ncbi:hypothetical protein ONZ43_g3768 [Nemania bipapillata]|uniref:Uncharacterized protein n=1 Tax=Nemania bipapillata TaxID=110536 RepID=A0ACC2IVJ5_9PEZI|nr:hypothetical protein ONZ43_g3768 [Nemania bipapillata]
MLRLGRHGLCRLRSSHICASCLATCNSSTIISRGRAIASHHVRPLSTTIACREAAPVSDSAAPTDVVAEKAGVLLPKKNKKKKKKPAQAGSTGPPSSPKKDPETDAQRQLKVLKGALSALKNVLTTQGVDVGQKPTAKPTTTTTTTTTTSPATPPSAKPTTPPAKAKSKPKPKSKSKAEKKEEQTPKVATTSSAPSEGVEPGPSTEAAEQKTQVRADHASAKKRPRAKVRALKRKTKPSKAKGAPKRSEEQSEEAKPANLGVPFEEIAVPFSGKRPPKHVTSNKLPDKVHPHELSMVPIETIRPDVPSLSYDLERVLFNPGVYQLQDPRSRVYNFDPYLSEIMPVNEFDFNALKAYVTSSKDSTLISIAKQHEKKYTGSTSSMTSMLAHFHFLLSAWREIDTSMLSRSFRPESTQYTRIMKAPAATFLHWKNGTYAIDADKEFDTANILSMLGKSMEKLLTLSKDEYERYRHGNSDQITEEERNADEAFHYTGFQDFMMRSQLDAHDQRVPGTGMFDLKTRAVISIRMDAQGYHKGLGYEIRQRFGQWESFEREYYDMIRSAFLKYSLQVRMGRMDGIFVAFHNTQRIFGFQYIPLTEMDVALHGPDNELVGDQEFKVSLKLLNELLNRATQKWPEQSLRLHFETRTSTTAPFMYFFAKPTTAEEIAAVQNAGRASIEAFEKDILGLVKATEDDVDQSSAAVEDTTKQDSDQVVPESTPAQEIDSLAAWQEARQMVEEAMGDDEEGVGLVREAIADALEQSGILRARSLAESREYVNALLGALIGRAPSTQADSATTQPVEEATVGENDLEEQVTDQTQQELDRPSPLQSEVDAVTLKTEDPQDVESRQGNAEDSPSAMDGRDSHADPHGLEVSSIPPGDSPHQDQSVRETHKLQSHGSQTTSAENVEHPGSITTHKTIDEATITTATTTSESHACEQKDVEEGLEEDDDYEEAGETEAESKEDNEDTAATSLEPLKSLIMRMARRVDERPASDMDIDRPQDDASKLQEFERILGRLISQSRMDKPQEATGDGISDQAPLESTAPNGSSVDKSESEALSTSDAGIEGTPQSATKPAPTSKETEKSELLGFTLTIKNKVNGSYVERPNKLTENDKWTVEYEIQEVGETRARKIYEQIMDRRRKVLYNTGDRDSEWHKMFQGNLKSLTKKGREFREQETQEASGRPVYIVGTEGPLEWGDVFRKQPKSPRALDEESSNSQE